MSRPAYVGSITPRSIAVVAGAVVVSAVIALVFLEWNPGPRPLLLFYTRLAFYLLVPFVLSFGSWRFGTLVTFLSVAIGSAFSIGVSSAYLDSRRFPLETDIRVAVAIAATLYSFALGMLLPAVFVMSQLWSTCGDEVEFHDWE